MIARLSMLPAILIAIAALAGGCGGDDSGASDGDSGSELPEVTTSSLSKAQFVKQAEAICREERKDLVDQVNAYITKHESDKKPPPETYADMFRAVMIPTVEAEIEKVSELGAPEGDEEQLEAIFAGQREALDELEKLQRVTSIEDFEDRFTEIDKRIRAYGFDDCTNSASF